MRFAFWRTGPLADYSNDELHTAALRLLYPGGTKRCYTVAECDRADAYIAEMREKYADAPWRMYTQIMGWLNYAQANVIGDRDRIKKNERVARAHKSLEALS